MRVLIDIGGTHVRMAYQNADNICELKKYRATTFNSLEDALEQYCSEINSKAGGSLRIATAGYKDGDNWRFLNRNPWVLKPRDIAARGWDIECILNDFEAGTWALHNLQAGEFEVWKEAAGASATKALVGPGTGMGLGYMVKNSGRNLVLMTHGGNMPAAALSDEQREIVKIFGASQYTRGVPVYENFVSGPGLYHLYHCICIMTGAEALTLDTAGLLEHKNDHNVRTAFRLFHEFFGTFAANAVITAHAYGGLYITGGVMDHLLENDLWDFNLFEQNFIQNYAESIRRDLSLTPINHLTMPNPAMKGLMMVKCDD